MGRPRQDLKGLRFGRLRVLSMEGPKWAAVCDCGGLALVAATPLTSGTTVSCGCARKEGLERRKTHGASVGMPREYRAWLEMRQRCLRPGSAHYHRYGGRGIGICPSWNSYEQFRLDMGVCPLGQTLDRRRNNEGYSKSNCRWATREEQSNNRECSVLRPLWGEKKSLAQWSRDPRCLVNYGALRKRVYCGWPLELAMTYTAKHWPKELKR